MKRSQEKISLLVPVYRKEDTLERCIDSLLRQKYSNLEILLIDDGSPDRCGEICDAFAKEDERIWVIHQRNQGESGARNRGIKEATGTYISFVDADDIIKPDYLTALYDCMNDSLDIIVGSNRPTQATFRRQVTNEEALELMFFDDNFGVNVWGNLYRKTVLGKDPFPLGVKMGPDMAGTYLFLGRSRGTVYTSAANYKQIGSQFTSIDDVNIEEFTVPVHLLEDMRKTPWAQKSQRVRLAVENALVRRSIWSLNMLFLSRKQNSSLQNYLLQNCHFYLETYGYQHLNRKESLALWLLTRAPKSYARACRTFLRTKGVKK